MGWITLSTDLPPSCFWKLLASRYPKPLVPLEKPAKEVVSPETTGTLGTVKKKKNKPKSVLLRCGIA